MPSINDEERYWYKNSSYAVPLVSHSKILYWREQRKQRRETKLKQKKEKYKNYYLIKIKIMGLGVSKECGSGTLYGAYAPPLQGIPLPKPLDPVEKKYCVTCPPDKKGGETMIVYIKGREQTILIPKYVVGKINPDNGAKVLTKPGDKFHWTNSEWKNVIASTLPSLPGAITIEAKPMIWASASKTYNSLNRNIDAGKQVGPMLQVAQQQLLIQAVNVGCNAVLGININITDDSSGERGNLKLVIATMSGTPCTVLSNKQIPAVDVNSSMVAAYNYVPGLYPEATAVSEESLS